MLCKVPIKILFEGVNFNSSVFSVKILFFNVFLSSFLF